MTLLAHLVARNEAARYLQAVLAALPTPLVHVYDDRSTDSTPLIAERAGATVSTRPQGGPSFLQDEGAFRQAAWKAFERAMMPRPGDWVLAIDCDELLVCRGDLAGSLVGAVLTAIKAGAVGITLPIPEIWDLEGPLQRVDGFWGGLSAPRLFEYRKGGQFKRGMACGSVPGYVTEGRLCMVTHGLAIAHLGYADEGDRQQKYVRYRSLGGHNPAHVASICKGAKLAPVEWSLPEVWRGPR